MKLPPRAKLGWILLLSLAVRPARAVESECARRLGLMIEVFRANEPFQWMPNFERSTLERFASDVRFDRSSEEDALTEYLRGSSVNLALRGHHDVHFKPVPLEPFEALITNLDHALSRLERYAGTCFRGESMALAELEKLRPGDVMEDPGFASASLDLTKAKSFEARFTGLGSVLLVIHSESGRIVPAHLYHRREWEILFPRGGRRRVLAIDRDHGDRPVIFIRWD